MYSWIDTGGLYIYSLDTHWKAVCICILLYIYIYIYIYINIHRYIYIYIYIPGFAEMFIEFIQSGYFPWRTPVAQWVSMPS